MISLRRGIAPTVYQSSGMKASYIHWHWCSTKCPISHAGTMRSGFQKTKEKENGKCVDTALSLRHHDVKEGQYVMRISLGW